MAAKKKKAAKRRAAKHKAVPDDRGAPRHGTRVRQTTMPVLGIDEAIRVAEVIGQYGKAPTKPVRIAAGLEVGAGGSQFRTLVLASIAYGLTEGGAKDAAIALTDLGVRAIAPTEVGDDLRAKRTAFLKPTVIGAFLRRYDGQALPPKNIQLNVLNELGVPHEQCERAFDIITDGAQSLGLFVDINGRLHVDLDADAPPGDSETTGEEGAPVALDGDSDSESEADGEIENESDTNPPPVTKEPAGPAKVFVTHGKNRDILKQVTELLVYGKFSPVVSAKRETVSKPVPAKVMDDMRGCAAAVIHVAVDRRIVDKNGEEYLFINENVLIEIGAAMALYGPNFILLVETGTELPSNLKGLYEVRYQGSTLDWEAGMRLLKAFNDFDL